MSFIKKSINFNFNKFSSKSFITRPYNYYLNVKKDKVIRNRKIIHDFKDTILESNKKRKLMSMFTDFDSTGQDAEFRNAQYFHSLGVINGLDQCFTEENGLLSYTENIRLATGVQKSHIKYFKTISLEKFDAIKTGLKKKFPQCKDLDFEEQLSKIENNNDRIDYIMENFYFDYENDFLNFYETKFIHETSTVISEAIKEYVAEEFDESLLLEL